MKTITHRQYLELLGLLLLAERHNRALNDIKATAHDLLGVEQDTDWIGDAVYGSVDADVLLQRLSITVAPRGGAADHGDQQR